MTINTDKLKSRKLIVMLTTVIVLAIDVPAGLNLDPNVKYILASAIPTYLVGQGLADMGKGNVPDK